MSIYVENAVSEVIPEPEPAGGSAMRGGERAWEALDRFRALQASLARDRLRTRAEEFDD